MVDIRADARLAQEVTLEEIKAVPALADMFLITRPRLSVQPVDVEAWDYSLRQHVSAFVERASIAAARSMPPV